MPDRPQEPAGSAEQWEDAGQELGQLLQQNLMQAMQPILNNLGEEIARALRQQLRRSGPQEGLSLPARQRTPGPGQGQHPALPRQPTEARHQIEPVLEKEVRARQSEENRRTGEKSPRSQYARIMTTTAMPGLVLNAPDTIKLWQDRLADMFRNADGFLGAYVLGNPGSTTGITITLWESEQAAMDSDALAQVVPEIQPFILGEPTVQGYQIIYSL